MDQHEPLFDDRADAYRTSGDMVAAIATDHFKLDVDETTHHRWCDLMGLMREIDTWADDSGVAQESVIEQLRSFQLFRDRYPSLAPAELDEAVFERMLQRTRRILRIGQLASRATTVKRHVAFRIIEANESVNLFADTATDYVSSQDGFRERFLPSLQSLGAAATLFDSLLDNRQDVRDGKHPAYPPLKFYGTVIAALVPRGKQGGKSLLHVGPLRHGAHKAGQRVVNRLRRGPQPYSNTYRFVRKKHPSDT